MGLNMTPAEIQERSRAEIAPRDLNTALEQRVLKHTTALPASEGRTRTLLALSPDGICVVDTSGRILTCNEQFARLHGFDHSPEVIGRNAAAFARPEEFARLRREVATALASGAGVARDIECEVLRRDGTALTMEYSVAQVPWPDVPGGVAFMSNVRDITRRKEMTRELEHYRDHLEEQIQARTADLQAEIAERTLAQAALQRCQANLAETQRIAHLGSWEVDLATDEVRLSDEMVRIFGFKPEVRPVTRADIWNAIHPDDRSAVQAEMTRAMQPDRVYNTHYRIVLPGGDTRVVYIQGEVAPGCGRAAHAHPRHGAGHHRAGAGKRRA